MGTTRAKTHVTWQRLGGCCPQSHAGTSGLALPTRRDNLKGKKARPLPTPAEPSCRRTRQKAKRDTVAKCNANQVPPCMQHSVRASERSAQPAHPTPLPLTLTLTQSLKGRCPSSTSHRPSVQRAW